MSSAPGHRRQVMFCLVLGVIGVGLLAVPAAGEGPVLVPISEGHGLSAIDTVGAVLLAVAGTWLEVVVVRRLPHLGLSARVLFVLGLLAGAGIGLLVASVFSGFFWWWAVGAAVSGAVLVLLVAIAVRS